MGLAATLIAQDLYKGERKQNRGLTMDAFVELLRSGRGNLPFFPLFSGECLRFGGGKEDRLESSKKAACLGRGPVTDWKFADVVAILDRNRS